MRLTAALSLFCAVVAIAGSAFAVITKDYAPRLAVSVEGLPGYVYYDRDYDVTIRYDNAGGEAVEHAVLTIVLPQGFLLLGQQTAAGPGGQRQYAWQLGLIEAGQSGEVRVAIRGSLPDDLTGAVYDLPGYEGHTAFVDGFLMEVTLTTASSSVTALAVADTGVPLVADLAVTKADSPDPVPAGSDISYSISLTNNGLSDAANVQLSDGIPADTTFASLTAPGGWSCSTPAPGGTGTVTCSIPTLASGAVANFTLEVNVNAGTPAATTITNTATASSDTADPDLGNNSDTETTTTVINNADVAVTKTDSPDPVLAGALLDYDITLTNNGPDDAQNVAWTDGFPPNTTSASLTAPAGWTCTIFVLDGTGIAACGIGTLASGASATFTLRVAVDADAPDGTIITNTVSVTTTATDPVAGNNSDTETTIVGDVGTVIIEVEVDPGPDGTNFSYTDSLPICDIGTLDDDDSASTPNSVTCVEPAGTYFVTQGFTPGYVLTSIECADADGGTTVSGSTANIDLADGETVRCVFHNQPEPFFPDPVVSTPMPTSTPTPSPTATTQPAPAQTESPTGGVAGIQPPSTGDGGLLSEDQGGRHLLGGVVLMSALLFSGLGLSVGRRRI